jgi:hypothetical protein
MTHPKPGHFERLPDLMDNARVDGVHHRVAGRPPFFQLGGYQPVGQPRRIDRALKLRQDERQRPDVVFVTVSDEDGADLIDSFLQVGDVWDDQIDPKHSFLWELDPAIDDYDVVFVFQGHHVFAYFPQAPQGNDT